MERPFGDLEQIADVVEAEAGSKRPEVSSANLEWWLRGLARTAAYESQPQSLVDHRPERLSRAPHFGFQTGCHVFIQGQGRSHILMLSRGHHDVN